MQFFHIYLGKTSPSFKFFFFHFLGLLAAFGLSIATFSSFFFFQGPNLKGLEIPLVLGFPLFVWWLLHLFATFRTSFYASKKTALICRLYVPVFIFFTFSFLYLLMYLGANAEIYPSKGRQREAKTMLAIIYAAASACRAEGYPSPYSEEVGFNSSIPVENSEKRYSYYLYFCKEGELKNSFPVVGQNRGLVATEEKKDRQIYFESMKATVCLDEKISFVAAAAGEISDKKPPPMDIWQINDRKEIKNIQPGF